MAELIKTVEHRPWLIPRQPWKFYQEWNDAIFLHWQVDLKELKKFVPNSLEIDLFDGQAWVSMVAFTMENMRPRNLPSFSPISNFDEINIRTYVKHNGKQGVYFLNIEGGSFLSCKLAKTISELPYQYSKMDRNSGFFNSKNKEEGNSFSVKFSVGDKLSDKRPIDKWLTERYALFQNSGSYLNSFEIHHQEWPINEIEILDLDLSYSRFKNLINCKPNKIQYSKGVDVIAWGKEKSLMK